MDEQKAERRLVLPSEIPWGSLRGKDLEECLYWLLHSMGAQELEWRVGGEGQGAADQGRDLEAAFYTSSPDSELIKERWWLEVKGRTGTVEPAAVKAAVNSVLAKANIDVFVVATNSYFSNPTRDWVKEWQSVHRRPRIKLWDKSTLESLICDRPDVVIRLFSTALTTQGKLQAVGAQFWDFQRYCGAKILEEMWSKKADLDWDVQSYLAILMSEIANGDIEKRPWGVAFSGDSVLASLTAGLKACIYFCARAENLGVSNDPYLDGMCYQLLSALNMSSVQEVITAIKSSLEGIPPNHHKALLDFSVKPLMQNLWHDLFRVCSSDCVRISGFRADKPEKDYWLRLHENDKQDNNQDRHTLILEKFNAPCKVGFPLNEEICCPLNDSEISLDNLEKTLGIAKQVIATRCIR